MLFTKIGSSYCQTDLPTHFSNQLYFSENSALGGFRYQSPYSLKYVLTGYESYDVEGREMLIKPGQFLLVSNGSEITALEAEGKAISIFIAPQTVADVATSLYARSVEYNLDNQAEATPPLFYETVYQQIHGVTAVLLRRITHFLNQQMLRETYEIEPSLFFELSEALLIDQYGHSARLKNLVGQKPSTIQEQYRRLMLGCQYLNDHWNKPFSLIVTATVATLSPYHFHRLFKACFNKTPYQYHLQIQMEKARTLLKKDNYSVGEIAFQLGYNSSTSFGRVFKKYFRQSPGEFRQTSRK